MSTDEVKETIDEAIQFTGVRHVRIIDRPRLLSDNGPCYVSKAFEEYLGAAGMSHVRCKPYHPMTQGKIERYHRSMKNVVKLENYYLPGDLVQRLEEFVEHYNRKCEPFAWTATADSIFEKLERLSKTIAGTGH